jgi:rubrerythrin
MGIQFNADEVFQLAETIEANAAAYYRRAAELHGETKGADVEIFFRLAAVEDEHQATFAAMRRTLSDRMREETASDPYLEAYLYVEELGGSHGGEGTKAVTAALTGNETVEDVLRTAIGLEQKSIAFYVGIQDMVPAKLGRDKIAGIIAEEKSHLAVLAGELRKVRGNPA